MADNNPLSFTIVLDDDTLRRIAEIAIEQADRLNDGLARNPMYADIDALLGLKNQDGETLLTIVGRWDWDRD